MTVSLSKCVRCGSADVKDKDIEKLVRVGDDVAALRVRATVCHHCGERYLSHEAIRELELARRNPAEGKETRFRALGRFLALQPDGAG